MTVSREEEQREAALAPKLTGEWLETLHEAIEVIGWRVDVVELEEFERWSRELAAKNVPSVPAVACVHAPNVSGQCVACGTWTGSSSRAELRSAPTAIPPSEAPAAPVPLEPGSSRSNWPARDVVEKLALFADDRLRTHDYDGDGWEELQRCRDVAFAWLAQAIVTIEVPGGPPHIAFAERDIELMRAAVAAYDAAKEAADAG